jgi:hypothetical protein
MDDSSEKVADEKPGNTCFDACIRLQLGARAICIRRKFIRASD